MTDAPQAPHRPFPLARQSLALARRSVIRTLRTPERLLDVTIQPIMFIVLFVYLFGGAVAGSARDYLQYVLPALVTMGVVFGSMQTGVSLNEDMKKGVFDRFRSLPIGRSAPLIGAVLGDMVRSVVAIAVPIAFGHVIGFRVRTDLVSALAACALMIGFSFCLSWLFVLLGMLVREPGPVQGLSIFALFPLTFGTNMFVPTETLPGWLQAWVEINPVSQVMTAVRSLLVGGPVAGPMFRSMLWGVLVLAVFAPLAMVAYRRRT